MEERGGGRRVRVALVLVDGAGDASLAELGGRTPLEAARTPRLDALARDGACGLMDPVMPGLACGSDTAHLALLGVPPRVWYRGRGAFETMGSGLAMRDGDIAFKSNFATVDDATGVVLRRRADRDFARWGPPLCELLSRVRLPSFPGVEVRVRYATEHRCGVRLRGPGLSDAVTGTDPLRDGLPLRESRPLEPGDAAAERASRAVNECSEQFRRALRASPLNRERVRRGLAPANAVLLRGCGARVPVPSFESAHGMRAFMVAPTCIIAGLGESLGMRVVRVPGATGDYASDLGAKAAAFVRELSGGAHDFGFLHVKAVDDAGHDRDAAQKVRQIERVDAMVGAVLDGMAASGVPHVVAVTADHSTPVRTGDHGCEPVPFAVAAYPPVAGMADGVAAYSEVDCADGGALGRFTGDGLMPLLIRVRDHAAAAVSVASSRGRL